MIGVLLFYIGQAVAKGGNTQDQMIYSAKLPLQSQNLTLKPWAGGYIAEAGARAYEGTRSIKVKSNNLFEGGTIEFGQPLDAAELSKDPSNVLRFTYYLDKTTVVLKTPKRHAIRSTKSTEEYPQRQQKGASQPSVSKIRFLFTTADGKKSELYLSVKAAKPTAVNGWKTVGIPFPAIKGFDATNKEIKSLTVSTDTYSTMFIGDLRVSHDDTPIRGEGEPASLTVRQGSQVTFTASGEAGLTPLIYHWNFGETPNGEPDADGRVVRHRFETAGTFTVTLTIADRFGYKKPLVQTIPVTVNH